MNKYIDAEGLRAAIEKIINSIESCPFIESEFGAEMRREGKIRACNEILALIDSLQQDETQVDKLLCSKIWWEEQGWIMIPPDATIKGIDSLLKQVRKKLQQEQSEVDFDKELKNKKDTLLWDAFGPMNGEQSLAIRDFARYFYELRLKARKEENK